jgi:beta-glucosidase
VPKDGMITLTIPITNTGQRSGTEIVQVYIRKTDDLNGPLRTLRGFKRVEIAAGKTAAATITLPYSAFEFYNEKELQMMVTPGEYEIWYGNSSAGKDLQMKKIMVQ